MLKTGTSSIKNEDQKRGGVGTRPGKRPHIVEKGKNQNHGQPCLNSGLTQTSIIWRGPYRRKMAIFWEKRVGKADTLLSSGGGKKKRGLNRETRRHLRGEKEIGGVDGKGRRKTERTR